MKKLSLISKAGVGVAVAALTATWVAGRAWAFNPQPDPPGFSGLVGIVEGQTARLNIVNVSPVPINAALIIRAGDGSVRPISRMVTLEPGQGDHLDLIRPVSERGGADRAEVYGEVVLLPAVRGVLPPDPYRPSLEVFGADGSTRVIDTNFHNPPSDHNPPGDHPTGN